MRAAIWLLALFAVAAAVALFAGNNQGTITVFWPPWRVDLSLNLVLVILLVAFVLLHTALRALSALFSLPKQARQWRLQQKERTLHAALLDAMVQLISGRFSRARKAAQAALTQEKTLSALGASLPQAQQVRVLSHLLAAESAQALQDKPARDAHLQQALNESADRTVLSSPETREGVQLRAARWALEDRDAAAALARLEELPQGAQRRTLALRLRLKAARQDRRTLEGAGNRAPAGQAPRVLGSRGAKHRARPGDRAAVGRARSGAAAARLDRTRRQRTRDARGGHPRGATHGGAAWRPALARGWLLPAWERMVANPRALGDALRVKLARALEAGLDSVDADWLARIESAQRNNPRDPNLQYLAGMACMKRQLWGKAQQLLTQAGLGLQDTELYRRAWLALAQLAEDRDDAVQAAEAWKRAAQIEHS
jgi:HemY protein